MIHLKEFYQSIGFKYEENNSGVFINSDIFTISVQRPQSGSICEFRISLVITDDLSIEIPKDILMMSNKTNSSFIIKNGDGTYLGIENIDGEWLHKSILSNHMHWSYAAEQYKIICRNNKLDNIL